MAEEAAAIRIQAVFRGHLTRSMRRPRPPASVSSSEALTDDEDDGAAVDAAVEDVMPDEEPEPAHDDEDSYSWWEDYERHEFRRWLLRLALKALAVGAAAGAARYGWLALAGRKAGEKDDKKSKTKRVVVTKLTVKKKTY